MVKHRDRFWATDEQLYAILDSHDAKVRAGEDDALPEGDGYYPFHDSDESLDYDEARDFAREDDDE
jgi:hypothetical protein